MSAYPGTFSFNIFLKIFKQVLFACLILFLIDTVILIKNVFWVGFNPIIHCIAYNGLNFEIGSFDMPADGVVFWMAPSQDIIFKVPIFNFDSPMGIYQDSFVTTIIILDVNRGFPIFFRDIVFFNKKFNRGHNSNQYLSRNLSRKLELSLHNSNIQNFNKTSKTKYNRRFEVKWSKVR
jgi:hypothetical protein